MEEVLEEVRSEQPDAPPEEVVALAADRLSDDAAPAGDQSQPEDRPEPA